MIVRLNNKETIRKKRLIFYHDDVFVIAHEVLRPLQGEFGHSGDFSFRRAICQLSH